MQGEVLRFTVAADADMSGVLSGVKQLQGAFNTLKLPENITRNITQDFEKLKGTLEKLKNLESKGLNTKKDLKDYEKLRSEAEKLFTTLGSSIDELRGKPIYLEVDAQKIKEAQAEINELENAIKTRLSNLKINLGSAFGGTISLGIDQMIGDMERGAKTSKTLVSAMEQMRQSISTGNFSSVGSQLDSIEAKAVKLKGASVNLLDVFAKWGIIDLQKPASQLETTEEKTRLLHTAFNKLREAFGEDDEQLKQLLVSLNEATEKKEKFEAEGRNNLAKEAEAGAQAVRDYERAADSAARSQQRMGDETVRMNEQIRQLQHSTQYFFGLRNMINLLKRGFRQAVNVIKELDEAMTQTAVVTEYSVDDMWAKLPEYTANANELGVTVTDMYRATTLYYQQGLKTNQALGLANETMKMARIAGLEAADATDAMTAALRGFNMEINEASAQRINDVYSKVAASSASNVEELSTAMEKTASLAHSAGMSFEGTTAFLAQMIETTREAPENLGTAMKTIVARFQEMKKNPLEIVDVEGEEVSYNKVDTALQSIGVSLKDANGQFRALDQVFLEIAQKWNTLTQTQQRYIATTAAGSRQQSRFIAMMSDYNRTVELMGYANDSAGASQKQFEKTLESLETKLAKLKNAWNAFLMNIANNQIVKFLVDGLAKGIGAVNKLINVLGLGSGALKSFWSLFMAFQGLRIGGRIANFGIGKLGGFLTGGSATVRDDSGNIIGRTNPAQARAINQPIVEKLIELIGITRAKDAEKAGQPTNTSVSRGYATYDEFKGVQKQIQDGVIDFSKLGQFDEKQFAAIFNKNDKLQKGMSEAFEKAGIDKSLAQGALKGNYKDFQEALKQEVTVPFKQLTEEGQKEYLEKFRADFKKQYDEETKQWADAAVKDARENPDEERPDEAIKESVRAAREASYEQTLAAKEASLAGQQVTTQFGKTKQEIEQSTSATEKFGGALVGAGIAVQNMGRWLGKISPMLGGLVTQAGSFMIAMGQVVTNLKKLKTVGSNIWNFLGGGLQAGIILGAVAAITAAIVLWKRHLQKVKDAAEEVRESYKKINEETTKNISDLNSWQDEFERLSKGVDKNGNNVNLSTDEYDRYLEIVEGIAKINPDIVEGYNAQGKAIITNNKALEETLRLEKERQELNQETYTSEASLEKLVAARNIDEAYLRGAGGTEKQQAQARLSGFTINNNPLGEQTKKIGSSLSNSKLYKKHKREIDKILNKYGIESLDALMRGQEDAVKKFRNNYQKIQNDLDHIIETDTDLDWESSILNSFEEFASDKAAFDEAVQPIYEQLAASLNDNANYEQIDASLRPFLQQYIRDIAGQDISASEMRKEVNRLTEEFALMTGEGSKYQDLLKEATALQDQYAKDLNSDAYKENAEEIAQQFDALADEMREKEEVYAQEMAEFYDNQAARIRNFTEGGFVDLSSALNTMSAQLAEAEGAVERFNSATEKDLATAAEGYKTIYDEIFKETEGEQLHLQGKGDKALWAGARELLGADTIKGMSKDEVVKELKKWEGATAEGKEGWNNFLLAARDELGYDNKFLKFNEDGTFDLNIKTHEDFVQLAKDLKVSEGFLTAMLNKGRQFADIDFMNVTEVRKAFASSGQVLTGTRTTTNSEGETVQDMFVKEETLRNALFDAGYTNEEDIALEIKRLESEGIKMMPSADSVDKKFFKDNFDIENTEDLINTLIQTGDYTKEEIEEYAKQAGFDTENFSEDYAEALRKLENPELVKQTDELEGINKSVSAILAHIDRNTIREGYLDDPKGEALKQSVFGDENTPLDTKYEWLAAGLGEGGKELTPEQFEQAMQGIKNEKNSIEQDLQDLWTGWYEAQERGDTYQQERLAREIEAYEEVDKYFQSIIDNAPKYYKERERDKEREERRQENRYNQSFRKSGQQQIAAANKPQSDAKVVAKQAGNQISQQLQYQNPNSMQSVAGTKSAINVGVTGELDKVKEVAELFNQLEEKNGKKSTIEAKTKLTGDYKEIDALVNEDKNQGFNFKVEAVDQATSTINEVKAGLNQIPANKTTTLKADSSGISKVISDVLAKITALRIQASLIKINGTASGMNQPHYSSTLPAGSLASGNAGSAATGRGGRIGPKGKGGLTLTGEKGYEIAWLPSEGKSMILGVGGPQMIDLPANAVVWSHEQSKDIFKRKGIDIGSQANENITGNGVVEESGGSSGKVKAKVKSSKSKSSSKKSDNTEVIINFSMEEVKRYNLEKKIDYISNMIDKRGKIIEKLIDRIGTKTSDINGQVSKEITELKNLQSYNNQLVASYQKDLKALDTGNYKEKISWNSGGKKNKEETVNLSNYIKNVNGIYQIDYNKLNKINDLAKREAIYKAVQSALDPLVNGLQSAEKAAQEAQDQLDDLRQQVTDTFYAWENELTRIYNATQRLEGLNSYRDRFTSEVEKQQALLTAGMTTMNDALGVISAVSDRENKIIQQQAAAHLENIKAQQENLKQLFSSKDEIEEYNRVLQKGGDNNDLKVAEDRMRASTLALGYLKNITRYDDGTYTYDVDYNAIDRDKKNGKLSEETYNAIKDVIDNIESGVQEANNSIKEGNDYYIDLINSYNDFFDQVVSIEDELLKGFEEQIKTEIDNNKKLSDTISTAMKDLLDKVKRILDLRRKQEDNQKTENDISKKQQRLAMLLADTSGNHAVEIAQLEKEIGDAQTSYQRNLEDQLLEKLQNQADEAKLQRERQIEIAQQQLDIAKATGVNAEIIKNWLLNPNEFTDNITEALRKARNFNEKGYFGQQQAENQLQADLTNLTQALFEISGKDGSIKNLLDKQEELLSALNTFITGLNIDNGSSSASDDGGKASAYNAVIGAVTKDKTINADEFRTVKSIANDAGFSAKRYVEDLVKNGLGWEKVLKAGTNAGLLNKYAVAITWQNKDKKWQDIYEKVYGKNSFSKNLKYAKDHKISAYKYASGGLASHTGPAWLDGTPAKPELVLNAQDTKNFIALKDVLRKAIGSTGAIENSYGGDSTYEININVDHLNNDYDVDKVAERVKKIIVKDSSYRNVTQVRKFR